ncbi:MAG: xanthine dehydrogenase accessory protein XdhC [Rhodocyclaceae bacterium]|nr:xanthine dehydrogenase accessory protein XdhC [Rhodocyclaceae bacterium]MBX3669879.1 xanthine dehydrogenase accessory protein XdhC [Rhodocyclaceae bacterium]
MHDWHAILELLAAAAPTVLVSVVSGKGSVPRAAGAKMLVSAHGCAGSIGGGHLEFKAAAIARDLLAGGSVAPQVQRFALGASLGQCCGGAVNLLFDPLPARPAWVALLAQALLAGTRAALLTALAPGAGSLAVTPDAICGSLGDAARDNECAARARLLLAARAPAQLVHFAGGGTAFFDPLYEPEVDVYLFGAGHVGRALVKILAELPCRIVWVDERTELFPPALPFNVQAVATDLPDAEVRAARPGACFLVMTHSHALDQMLAECILTRGDFTWFGLIGSASKRAQFEKRLAVRGVPAERLARMLCPIGLPGIAGKQPAVIALSVAAQLMQQLGARAAKCTAAAGVQGRGNS